VAVTGAASGLGQSLARRLVAESDLRVIAVDDHRGAVEGATWRVADVLDPGLVTRLSRVDVLVHLSGVDGLEDDPATRRERMVRAAQTVLTAAAAAGVRRVVLLSSAMVYGARADNPVPLPEDAPLGAVTDASLVGDLLEIERLAAKAPRSHPGLQVTVLRPAALVGPGVDTLVTRHFEAPRLLVVRDTRMCWQFCHVDDLVAALHLAALERVTGVVAVGCDGWLDQDEVEHISGRRRIELSQGLAFATAERLHRLGLIPAPASDLQYVVHPWVVSCERLRAAGWRPTYDNATALGVLLAEVSGRVAVAGHRLGRKDATVGAAGAAVAVVGTAALVRRARRRRRSRS
jgi:nucleoside-diphosphate-sugar epimerase